MPAPAQASPTPAPGPTPGRAAVKHLDARSLRALAHPLRLRIVSSLRHEGPATATVVGQRLGESSGSTSYHLRVLAAHGFVEEDTGRGRGRERWWRSSADMTSWRPDQFLDDPDARAAEEWLTGAVARQGMEWADEWLRHRPEADPAWVAASDLSDYRVVATPDQVRALMDDVHATIARHVDALAVPEGGAAPEGAAPVRLLVYAIPRAGQEPAR
ncbi:MAG TPA: helix-turn-helix domain-containing protein [Acidimicrobiales bacterium]|nr:helix-turn-helix domain-containing protein [Acidimicrobiales bacterium]